MKKVLFPRNSELDILPITLGIGEIKIDEGFYKINKKELLEDLPYEQRLSNSWAFDGMEDRVFFEHMVKVIFGISKLVSKSSVNITFDIKKGSFAILDGESNITVAIDSLTDHRIPFNMRVNVIIALSLHETAHIAFTKPGIGNLLSDSNYTKVNINKFNVKIKTADWSKLNKILINNLHSKLHNIVEDRRIEHLLLQLFPGYVFYLDQLRTYGLYQHINSLISREKEIKKHKKKLEFYSEGEYWDCLTQYIAYRVLLPEAIPYFIKVKPNGEEFEALMSKVDKIIQKEEVTSKGIIDQATKLLKLYPKEQQKHSSKSFLPPNPMISPEQEWAQTIGPGLTDAQRKLIEETVELFQKLKKKNSTTPSIISQDGSSLYNKFSITRPNLTYFDQEIYSEATKIARTISRTLSFLDSRFNRTRESFELYQGELDESELYALQFNKAIFTEEEPSPGYKLDFGVLIDESGSMGMKGGKKIKEAKIAGLSLALALNNHPSINLFVYGHTADNGSSQDREVEMYCYYDKFEKQTDINGMFSICSRANNADGYAIAKMGELMQRGLGKQKVLVVISDGEPNASGYGGNQGIIHTRNMVKALEKKGYFVIQICVANISKSPKMFTHFIPFKGEELGKSLKKILDKELIDISHLI